TTDSLLAEGKLGERGKKIYTELGSALSLLAQAASCAWGCRAGDHLEENLIRRLANYSFASIRLARLGLYSESIGMLRALAELANLIELFAIDKTCLKEWSELSAEEKWWRFRPKRVQERIAKTGNRPIVDKETYSKLCELGVHVSPESAKLSHQF